MVGQESAAGVAGSPRRHAPRAALRRRPLNLGLIWEVFVIVKTLRGAFPDLHYALEDLVAADDAVAARTTMTGTHCGDFFGLAPTRRSIRVAQMTLEKIRDGRIVAHHRITDELSLLRQLGVVD